MYCLLLNFCTYEIIITYVIICVHLVICDCVMLVRPYCFVQLALLLDRACVSRLYCSVCM